MIRLSPDINDRDTKDAQSGGRRTLLMPVVLALALLGGFLSAPPAAAEDAPNKQLIEKGREIFLTAGGMGCAACHGRYAEGDVGIGPNNRGLNEAKVRAALDSVPPMKTLRDELSDAQIKEVAAYVEWLGQLKLVKTIVKRGHFVPERVEIYPGTKIQLVVTNASIEPHKLTGDNMKIAPVTVPGHENMDIVWEAPDSEGTFSLTCTDCGATGQLTIVVSKNAKKFVPATPVSKSTSVKPSRSVN